MISHKSVNTGWPPPPPPSHWICSNTFHPLFQCLFALVDSLNRSRSVIPVVYIKTTVDQWSQKWQSKHNYICKYNNLPTTCFGRDWPSSGWDTMSEELYIYCKYRYGGTRSRLQTYGACGRIGVGTRMCPFGTFICWVVGLRAHH